MKTTAILTCAGAIALVASTAAAQTQAAPAFRITEIGFGGESGPGIMFDSAYQDPNGTNFPPTPGNTSEFEQLQFDSYVALGGSPVTPDSAAFAPDVVDPGFDAQNGYFDEQGLLRGRVFSDNGTPSLINPLSGRESVFFARLTVPTGTFITGTVSFTTVEFGALELPIEFVDASGTPTIDDPSRGFREFKVVSQKTESRKALNVFSESEVARGLPFTTELFDVYDLYIEQVPAPGAASLLGLAGLAALRRRR